MTDAAAELAWWNNLTAGERLDNTAGHPPYAVDDVARRIDEALNITAGTILDLGCGTGRLTREVANRLPGCKIIATDPAPRLLAESRRERHPRIAHRLGDGTNLPGRLPRLVGAYSVTVFQHLPHEVVTGYITQIAQRLTPGARFVFTHSLGTEDAFCSHQATTVQISEWVAATGLRIVHGEHDHRGWWWTTCTKL